MDCGGYGGGGVGSGEVVVLRGHLQPGAYTSRDAISPSQRSGLLSSARISSLNYEHFDDLAQSPRTGLHFSIEACKYPLVRLVFDEGGKLPPKESSTSPPHQSSLSNPTQVKAWRPLTSHYLERGGDPDR